MPAKMLRRKHATPKTKIPVLLKVFDGSINFDIIACRYKYIQNKIATDSIVMDSRFRGNDKLQSLFFWDVLKIYYDRDQDGKK
jgi:hypothetical protein